MTLKEMITHGQQMVRGGMSIETALMFLKSNNGNRLLDPESEKELKEGIVRPTPKSVTSAIHEWVEVTTSGVFSTTDIYNGLQLTTREQKKSATVALLRMCKENPPLIERYGSKAGHYRIIQTKETEMDIQGADLTPLPIQLPMGLSDFCNLYRGNVVCFAGTSNAGKSAMCLNVALMNMDAMQVKYIDSDSGEQEIRERLSKFSTPLKESVKKIKFVELSGAYADHVSPDALNIFDYVEDNIEAYKVPEYIRQIHQKLNNGIAVIALQKPKEREFGQGGQGTINKSRLYVSIDFNTMKIVKCKNRKVGTNPNGMMVKYKLEDSVHYVQEGLWYRPE